ncbi:DNA-binding protein [Streptomyces lincolnensis]|uniref:DNA-binding protein n=1 Tax=Streptomyces lincolnensis TaxID=1915 RepID=A0A1B1MCE8_STRLN|nr:helix-turn-helix transcriptional regulator [Streptomyces lincolnensis]ANS66147.1 DNA-binding protein [Streptomyces lincolnensis]AXG54089.1 DNA-binding protein [Streptomyces lincolnensis]QMV08468.1 helix-turn-helix domain-containing protein [Streptomyces lincolnensis]
MATLNVGNLGEYLREQRRNAQLSLRQLADAAGVSNPYLSQIERGLRKPSAEVLQQVAKALRISAETLYVRAGILDAERDRDEVETRAVILADPTLNERQKQVLLQIYESFRKENGFEIATMSTADTWDGGGTAVSDPAADDTVASGSPTASGGEPATTRRTRRTEKNDRADQSDKAGRNDGGDADPQQTAS